MNALAAGGRAVWDSLSRIGHLLWLEVTGFFFVAFAAIGGAAAWHEYSKHKMISGRLVAAVCFSVVFGWFGLSSFWRVRRRP